MTTATAKNSTMKKFNRKATGIVHTVSYPVYKIDGREDDMGMDDIKIRTTCKVFGSAVLDENGNFTGDCGKCKQDPEVKAACIYTSPAGIAIQPASAIKTGSGSGSRKIVPRAEVSIKDFVGMKIDEGCWSRKEIIAAFLAAYPENNQTQGGRYVSSSFNAKYSMKRWGKVAQVVEGKVCWK